PPLHRAAERHPPRELPSMPRGPCRPSPRRLASGLFDTPMLFGSKEGCAIHERANFGRAPAGCFLRERLETELSRWPPCQVCVKDPSPLILVWQIDPNM